MTHTLTTGPHAATPCVGRPGLRGRAGICIAIALLAAACGGSSTAPSSTGGSTSGGGTTTGPIAATVTVTASGVSPKSVTVPVGSSVNFVNNDSKAHDMSSDPHPEHSNCPELNQWGFLSAGQQRTSGNLNTARTCGFHDHNLPQNANLQGTVIIQ